MKPGKQTASKNPPDGVEGEVHFASEGCDVDDQGRPVFYWLELWEYADFLKRSADGSRYSFRTKRSAVEFAQARLEQGLVAEMHVTMARRLDRERYEYLRIFDYYSADPEQPQPPH